MPVLFTLEDIMRKIAIKRPAASLVALDMVSILLVAAIVAAVAMASGELKVGDTGLDRLVAGLSQTAGE